MPKALYHIVHTESSGGWGGQEIRILNEAREFIKRGHPVTLVVSDNSPIAARAKEYNINTVELPIGKKTLKGLMAMRRWIADNDFDVINTHSSSDSWMVALGMRLAFKKKPLVRTRHVSAPVSNNRSTRWLYHKASNHIVTTGEKLKETLSRDNGLPPAQVTSVPTGIDCSTFTPPNDKDAVRQALNLPTDKYIIGIVATLRSWKGHEYLIEAFHALGRKDTHLLIVGNGPQWDNIHQQVQQLGLMEQVTLCGDKKDVVPWLQAMDIFTLPSYANEGVPQGLMQAMACGLPVISTNVGSISELVNGDTGIVVDTKNAQAIEQSLHTLLDNENYRQQLQESGMAHVNNKFSIERMVEKMDQIFKRTIEVSNEM